MKKLIPVLMFALLGTACDDLQGTLNVQSGLTLKTKKNELINLAPGVQSAKFDLDEGDRELEIKIKDARGKEKKAELKYPVTTVIPKYRGTFALSALETGQSFDLKGAIDTDINEGPSLSSNESCTYQRPVRVIREVPVYNREGKVVGYRREHRTEYQTVYGLRLVRYHSKTTTISGQAQFLAPQTATVLATFNGSNTFSETVYEYRGQCY